MAGGRINPSEVTKKMIARAQGAGEAWKAGVQASSGTITSNMRKASNRWKTAMQAAIAAGSWDKAIAGLTDEKIIAAALAVGDAAWLNGITSREDKILAAWQIMGPKLEAHMAKINAMPADTEAQREAKMLENLRGMRKISLA